MDFFALLGEISFKDFNTLGKAGAIILVLSAVVTLVAFLKVTWSAFAKKDPLLGILGVVCQLWFILGWIRAGKWEVRGMMLLATLAIFGFIIGFGLLIASAGWGIVNEVWELIKSPFSG